MRKGWAYIERSSGFIVHGGLSSITHRLGVSAGASSGPHPRKRGCGGSHPGISVWRNVRSAGAHASCVQILSISVRAACTKVANSAGELRRGKSRNRRPRSGLPCGGSLARDGRKPANPRMSVQFETGIVADKVLGRVLSAASCFEASCRSGSCQWCSGVVPLAFLLGLRSWSWDEDEEEEVEEEGRGRGRFVCTCPLGADDASRAFFLAGASRT